LPATAQRFTATIHDLPTARTFLHATGIPPGGMRLADDLAAQLILHLALTAPAPATPPTTAALRAALALDTEALRLTLAYSTVTDVRHLMRLHRRNHPVAALRDALAGLATRLAPLTR
jgi:hypothetical protein